MAFAVRKYSKRLGPCTEHPRDTPSKTNTTQDFTHATHRPPSLSSCIITRKEIRLCRKQCGQRSWATKILKYVKVRITASSNIRYDRACFFYQCFLPFQRPDSSRFVHESFLHLLTTVQGPLFIQEFKSFAFQKMVPFTLRISGYMWFFWKSKRRLVMANCLG